MNEPTPTTVTWRHHCGVREIEPQDGWARWEFDGTAFLKISGSAEDIQALVKRLLADGTLPTEARKHQITLGECLDCAVLPGDPHDPDCDVARCLQTGHQRLTCQAEHDCGQDKWTGTWPGLVEARRYGVDFNTLTGSGHYVWDQTTRRWTEPAEASELLAPDMTLVSTPDLTKPNDLADRP
ncbi:MAG TPA: hypothetical protein VFU40_07065 [Gemmatimonadales bacterium]|nr:hypothetical protein [Gemmatimonadales bacterium]